MIRINLKKVPAAKSFKALLLLVLSALGIVSCDIFGGMKAMYGCPTTDFSISGNVTDEANDPIENIKVTIFEGYQSETEGFVVSNSGSTKTDELGEVSIDLSTVLVDQVRIVAEDIDGEAHGGEFAPSDTLIIKSFEQIKKGDGNWYMGKYASKGNIIKMKKK